MKPGIALTVLTVLASCGAAGGALNPTVGQLDDMKTLAARGDDAVIAAMSVSCAPSAAGCAQSHAIRAGACRRTGLYDCAVSEYRAGLAAARLAPDPQTDPAALRLALLESAHARRDAARGAAADGANRQLLSEAIAAQTDPRSRTAGYFYAANATLFTALQTQAPGGCDVIDRAAGDLSRARTEGSAFQANGQALEQAIANARISRRCPA